MHPPLYLSPTHPHVTLETEDQLQTLIDQGLLEENHYFDLKEQLEQGKSANKKLAVDLAAFSIDGGTVIVGVLEDKDAGVFKPAPVPLAGLSERIEEIGRKSADPPVEVMTREIASAQGDGLGYIVIHIPPSPMAPHMVDGMYRGRGDKTNRVLPDAEVARLFQARSRLELDGLALIRREIARDPFPNPHHQRAPHLFIIAQPVTGRPDMLLSLTHGKGSSVRLSEFVTGSTISPDVRKMAAGFHPDLTAPLSAVRRAGGAAMTSGLGSQRRPGLETKESNVVDLEVHEDGGLRFYLGNLGEFEAPPYYASGTAAQSPTRPLLIFDAALVLFTWRVIALAVAAGNTAGYLGNWTFAIGANGLRTGISYVRRSRSYSASGAASYGEDLYMRATTASYAEMVQQPGNVADRLIGPLLRSLDSYEHFKAALSGE